ASLLQGEAMYTMRYGFWITTIASAKMAWKRKSFNVFLNNIVGFAKADKENQAFIVTPDQGKFIRKLRWRNIRSKLF
ncbi:MAG: glycosyltransferase family 2 protein, partial [Flavobacteriaceae bacterium]